MKKAFRVIRNIALCIMIVLGAQTLADAQEFQYKYKVIVTTEVSPVSVPITGHITLLQIAGTNSLTANYTISASGSPSNAVMIRMIYDATITLNGHDFIVFGETIPEELIDQPLVIYAFYVDGSWEVYVLLDHSGASQWITKEDIAPGLYDNVTIELDASNGFQVKDAGLSLAKLSNWTTTQVAIANAGGVPTAVTVSGDLTNDAAGAFTIANDAVTTVKILDENITLNKIEDLARGSIIVGTTASNRPTAVDGKGAGQFFVGDGTDINSVSMSNDGTLSVAGVFTIANNAVETAMILDANVTLDKVESITAAYMIVGNASARPTAVAISNDIGISNTGAATIQPSSVETAMIEDGAVTADKISTETAGGKTTGFLNVKYISATQFKALLDGSVNSLFELKTGEILAFVQIAVQTAAGTAVTIDIGADGTIRSAGQDVDAFVVDANGNATTLYNTVNDTYRGIEMDFGYFVADATGNILIQSSANVSASSIVATASIYYTSNN